MQNQDEKEPKSGKRPKPAVLSVNICDAIIRDEATKKVSLIGLFNTINANSFPCIHPLMHVYIALTNGHGKYKTDVRFLDLKENKPIVGMIGDLEFQNPLQVVELNLCWQGLRIPRPGEYAVEVQCDGDLVGQRRFRVMGPKQDKSSTDGTEVM